MEESDSDPFDEEPPEQLDFRVRDAKPKILGLLHEVKVATDRELKVRLERDYFPWVVGRALGLLLQEGEVLKFGYAGRRRIGGSDVESFYTPRGVLYESVREIIGEKKAASDAITNLLMGVAPAAGHAEDLFEKAFGSLKFTIHGRNVSEFRGHRALGVRGKEPPNVDFVIERDGVLYGADVKNWIRYEWGSRIDVIQKVQVAKQLGVVPFIIARYLDQDVLYNEIYQQNGLAYRYVELLVPPVYDSVAKAAKELLGYPVLASAELPEYKVKWLERLHMGYVGRSGD